MVKDLHSVIPWGICHSVEGCKKAEVRFFHVSISMLQPGIILSSSDFDIRPHYELFRSPPLKKFLSNPRFLKDRQLEAVFEQVRLMNAPDAPSRKSAFFSFICKACADWFQQRSRIGGVITELIPLSEAKIFISDLVWRNIAANILLKSAWQDAQFPFLIETEEEALWKIAEAYWSGQNPKRYGFGTRPEALIEGKVTIINQK